MQWSFKLWLLRGYTVPIAQECVKSLTKINYPLEKTLKI